MSIFRKTAAALASTLVLVTPLVAVVSSAEAAPKPRSYANCTALNKVYPHGVALKGAKDKTSGKPVTNFKVSYEVYRRNNGKTLGHFKGERDLDRDNDKIACEKR
jgi:hypothetical protein